MYMHRILTAVPLYMKWVVTPLNAYECALADTHNVINAVSPNATMMHGQHTSVGRVLSKPGGQGLAIPFGITSKSSHSQGSPLISASP